MTTYVWVKCAICGAERRIGENEIAEGDQPMCNLCLGPMIPKWAETTTRPTKHEESGG